MDGRGFADACVRDLPSSNFRVVNLNDLDSDVFGSERAPKGGHCHVGWQGQYEKPAKKREKKRRSPLSMPPKVSEFTPLDFALPPPPQPPAAQPSSSAAAKLGQAAHHQPCVEKDSFPDATSPTDPHAWNSDQNHHQKPSLDAGKEPAVAGPAAGGITAPTTSSSATADAGVAVDSQTRRSAAADVSEGCVTAKGGFVASSGASKYMEAAGGLITYHHVTLIDIQ
eukprot:TRINITY_DN78154_c0_g1_i1.p1 TRINITY_DN78154_c0_g1~~TRINITY_DN78154_c0_g1_i1.p1  ORF type:complete len:225 (+),score=41.10 TRINITY_DN78154_c0_g1_i1:127-801(+)